MKIAIPVADLYHMRAMIGYRLDYIARKARSSEVLFDYWRQSYDETIELGVSLDVHLIGNTEDLNRKLWTEAFPFPKEPARDLDPYASTGVCPAPAGGLLSRTA